MPHVPKAGMVLHLRVHHGMVWRRRRAPMRAWLSSCPILIILIFVPSTTFVRKVRWPLMLMRAAIVLKAPDDLIDVRRRVLIQLLVMTEDDDRDVDRAEDGELMRLLEQAAFALEERDRPATSVSNSE